MKLRLATILAGMVLLASTWVNGDELVTPEQAVAYTNRVVMDISRGRFDEAWTKLKENSSIPQDRINAFALEYDSHYVRTIQYFGPSTGVELISQDIAGKSLMRVSYLVKYQVTGVVWYMYFYRLKDQWILSEFNYDINSSELFNTVVSGTDSKSFQLMWGVWQQDMERRLAEVEKRPAAPAAMPMVNLQGLDMDDKELALLNMLESRLAELERQTKDAQARVERVEANMSELAKSGGGGTDLYTITSDIADMKRTIRLLKTQHPYVDFGRK